MGYIVRRMPRQTPPQTHQCRHRLSETQAFERLESELRKQSSRMTAPRRSILKAALGQKIPFSAETLQNKARTDLATVYRTLALFEEIGLLQRIDVQGESAVYEIASNDTSHHHHYFACEKCGYREHLEVCTAKTEEALLKRKGFTALRHRLEFTGLCPSCSTSDAV